MLIVRLPSCTAMCGGVSAQRLAAPQFRTRSTDDGRTFSNQDSMSHNCTLDSIDLPAICPSEPTDVWVEGEVPAAPVVQVAPQLHCRTTCMIEASDRHRLAVPPGRQLSEELARVATGRVEGQQAARRLTRGGADALSPSRVGTDPLQGVQQLSHSIHGHVVHARFKLRHEELIEKTANVEDNRTAR
eukprot:scaffold4566_cov118-Isochrysis_galbana.AAC.8